LNLINFWRYRNQTPPTTPQRVRSSAQQDERDQRFLDSPVRHRTPHHVRMAQLGAAVPPIPAPVFVAPPVVPPPAPLYRHLPAHLAQQLAALPPMNPVYQGRRQLSAAPAPAPVLNNGQGGHHWRLHQSHPLFFQKEHDHAWTMTIPYHS